MDSRPLVLVVDDDPYMLELARVHLEGAGYGVELAASGEEGVAKAIALTPAAILLDYAMPGVSGRDTLKRIRANRATAQVPVLVLTAWASDEDAREMKSLGAGWMEKPVRAEVLVEAMGSLVK